MTDTETTSATATFADELSQLVEQYKDEQVRASWRNEQLASATTHYLDTLLASDEAWASFQDSARTNVKASGKKTASLLTWSGRGPSHEGQFLTDLLDLGELLAKLQDVLDLNGGKDKFLVFKHSVPASRGNGPRSFSLTVSWDESRFDNGRDIIAGEREKAEQRVERSMRRRLAREEGGDEEDEDRRPARRSNYRGGDDRRGGNDRRGGDDRRPARRPNRDNNEDYDSRRGNGNGNSGGNANGDRRAPRRRPAKYEE